MGSVPSMNGKARETTLLMRDMRLGGATSGLLLPRLTRRQHKSRKYFPATSELVWGSEE